MICPNCGTQLPDDAAFCGGCGSPMAIPAASSPTAAPIQTPAYSSEPPAVTQDHAQPGDPGAVQQGAGELGMKWFKFIIYFQLFFSAVIGVVSGVGYFGLGSRMMSVGTYPAWIPIWLFVNGTFLVVWSAFAVFVRFQLSSFKSGAPRAYLVLLGVSIAVGIVSTVVMMVGLGSGTPGSDTAASIAVNSILFVLNIVYFRKRKHLFVN